MGHICQEITLGAVRLIRYQLGLTQFITFTRLFFCAEQIDHADYEHHYQQRKHPQHQHDQIVDPFHRNIAGDGAYHKHIRILYLRSKQEIIPFRRPGVC